MYSTKLHVQSSRNNMPHCFPGLILNKCGVALTLCLTSLLSCPASANGLVNASVPDSFRQLEDQLARAKSRLAQYEVDKLASNDPLKRAHLIATLMAEADTPNRTQELRAAALFAFSRLENLKATESLGLFARHLDLHARADEASFLIPSTGMPEHTRVYPLSGGAIKFGTSIVPLLMEELANRDSDSLIGNVTYATSRIYNRTDSVGIYSVTKPYLLEYQRMGTRLSNLAREIEAKPTGFVKQSHNREPQISTQGLRERAACFFLINSLSPSGTVITVDEARKYQELAKFDSPWARKALAQRLDSYVLDSTRRTGKAYPAMEALQAIGTSALPFIAFEMVRDLRSPTFHTIGLNALMNISGSNEAAAAFVQEQVLVQEKRTHRLQQYCDQLYS